MNKFEIILIDANDFDINTIKNQKNAKLYKRRKKYIKTKK